MEFGELIQSPTASYISFSWTFSWHILVPTRIGCSNLHRHHLLELPDVCKAFQLLGRICKKNANILMAICQTSDPGFHLFWITFLCWKQQPQTTTNERRDSPPSLVSIFMFLLVPPTFTLTEEADLGLIWTFSKQRFHQPGLVWILFYDVERKL